MNQEKIIMAFDIPDCFTKPITREEIIGKKQIISKIDLQEFHESITIDGKKIVYTDKDNPLSCTGDESSLLKTLHINPDYYEEHMNEINKLICFIASSEITRLSIKEQVLITKEVIDTVTKNEHLKEVTFGAIEKPYTLDKRTYETLKSSAIESIYTWKVTDDLKSIYDEKLYAPQFNDFSLYDLSKRKYIFIVSKLSSIDLDNLKYIMDDVVINIQSNDYENVLEIVKRINTLKKKCHLEIDVRDKNIFNKILFDNIEHFLKQDINITASYSKVDLKTYVQYEDRLYYMIEPAKDLSPFEKYLFAYNVVKNYKEYKENINDKMASRNLYEILDNEYMVCVGYSELLGDLLNKLGIINRDYNVEVDSTFEDVPLDAHVVTEDMLKQHNDGSHARKQIHLIDEKYGIDGIFIADPTWDNDMKHDAYNHALMTPDEYIGTNDYTYLYWNSIDEVFFVHDLEEFYKKANIWMDKMKFKNSETHFIYLVLRRVKELDNVFYWELCKKYPKIEETKNGYTKEEVQKILYDLGSYIVFKVNKPITGTQLKEAITVLYEKCYGIKDYKQLEAKVQEVMEYNKNRQEIYFPTRYKQDKEGNDVPYLNAINKFDLDIEKQSRHSI